MTPCRIQPSLTAPLATTFDLQGPIGARLRANTEHWLLVAPDANPAMLANLRERDRGIRGDLLPWAGEFPGKYLTSAVGALRLTGDERLRTYLQGFVRDLIAAQAADGYFGPFPRATRLTGPGIWDLWGNYHCMLGLLRWHEFAGDSEALAACRRAADLMCRTFLGGELRVLRAGSEEMNQSLLHILCLLYELGGEERYLRLAREVEQDIATPPSGDWLRLALAGREFYESPKPRWESLHALQGLAELHYVTGEEHYRQAFEQIWWSIAGHDRHNTGGFTSGEQATGNPYDGRAIETCCTIAWSALSVDMLRLTGEPLVADELEIALWNALLGAQSASGRWWTYNTPMDGYRKASAHDIVFQARAGGPELNCCSVNGPRGLGMIAEWAALTDGAGVTLNYYGPGSIEVPLADGRRVRLEQETGYPVSGRILLRVQPQGRGAFTLRLRIPSWSERTRVAVNGQELVTPTPGRYLEIGRDWAAGDTVQLDLDMGLRYWVGERDCWGRACVYRGPLLLAYDPRFDTHAATDVPALRPVPEGELLPTAGVLGPNPLLLLHLPTEDGRSITLCDFLSAGATGARYATWLPLRGLAPRPFSRRNPWRTQRVG